MSSECITIREAKPNEYNKVGQLMVDVYAGLAGFLSPEESPEYYQKLSNVGALADKPGTMLLVAVVDHKILGAVVYFSDIRYYGARGIADQEAHAAGFRLLAVDYTARGKGVGKLLTNTCIQQARDDGREQVIIHSTRAMHVAWKMYEELGFLRAEHLDLNKSTFPVFGFRLML